MHHIQQGIFVALIALTFWCYDAGRFRGHFQCKKNLSDDGGYSIQFENKILYQLISQTQPGFSGIFIFYLVDTHNDLHTKLKLLFYVTLNMSRHGHYFV